MKPAPPQTISRSACGPASNSYWLFTTLLIIPPTASAGSSNFTTSIDFCLLWLHYLTLFQIPPLATLPEALLVWTRPGKVPQGLELLLRTILLPNVSWTTKNNWDTSYHWTGKLFYTMDALCMPFPLSQYPLLLPTGKSLFKNKLIYCFL